MVMRFSGRAVRCLGLAGIAAGGYVAGLMSSSSVTAQPPAGAALPPPDRRVVAYIYNNVPVTREELGDFLIARGGYEKLDLLVNKKVIELEAARRNISVTAYEIQAALETDVKGLGITLDQFSKDILKKRYNKSLYEWTEDVIKPKLLLTKMCKERVQVTDVDLQRAYDNKYGEKRRAKIICWNKEDLRAAQRQWEEARKSDEAFDHVARTQADPRLAASCGMISPIGRYPEVEDETCTKILYQLKVGEVSQLFQTPAGVMCIKLVEIVPPNGTVYKITDKVLADLKASNIHEVVLEKLRPRRNKDFAYSDLLHELDGIVNDELIKLLNAAYNKTLTPEDLTQLKNVIISHAADATASFNSVRPALQKEVYDKKMTAEVPKFFAELKAQAKPNLLLKGPPSSTDIQEAAKQEIQELNTPPKK